MVIIRALAQAKAHYAYGKPYTEALAAMPGYTSWQMPHHRDVTLRDDQLTRIYYAKRLVAIRVMEDPPADQPKLWLMIVRFACKQMLVFLELQRQGNIDGHLAFEVHEDLLKACSELQHTRSDAGKEQFTWYGHSDPTDMQNRAGVLLAEAMVATSTNAEMPPPDNQTRLILYDAIYRMAMYHLEVLTWGETRYVARPLTSRTAAPQNCTIF